MFCVGNTGYDIVGAVEKHDQLVSEHFDAVVKIVEVKHIGATGLV